MTKPLFRLFYFPTHGRALPIRLAAVLNGITWEDCLIKPEAYRQMKSDGTFTPRWSGLPQATFYNQPQEPVIDVAQSSALLRYVAHLKADDCNYNLYPTRHRFDCLLIDEVMDSLEDITQLLSPSLMEQDETKKLEMRKELTDNPNKLPLFLQRYNEIITENDTSRGHRHGYLVGDCLSIADLEVFSFISYLHPEVKQIHSYSIDGFRDDLLDNYPKVKNHAEMLANHETIKKFIESFNKTAADFIQNENEQQVVVQHNLLQKEL